MGRHEHDEGISDVSVALNIIVACGYVVIASLANVWLLQKDARLRADRRALRRANAGGPSSDRRLPAHVPAQAYVTPVHSQRPGSVLRSESSETASRVTTPLPPPQCSALFRVSGCRTSEEHSLLTPRSRQRLHDQQVQQQQQLQQQQQQQQFQQHHRAARPALIFSEYTCWFFILIIVFCINRTVAILVLTLLSSPQTLTTVGTRKTQDYVVSTATFTFYCVFIVLLNALFFMTDAERHKSIAHYRAALAVMLGGCFLAVAGGVASEALNASDFIVEYICCAIDLLIAIGFSFAALYLPQRLQQHGEFVRATITKVRTVAWLVAFCMLARGVILFPALQTAMGDVLGDYSFVFLMCFEYVPVICSVRVLHTTPRQQFSGHGEP